MDWNSTGCCSWVYHEIIDVSRLIRLTWNAENLTKEEISLFPVGRRHTEAGTSPSMSNLVQNEPTFFYFRDDFFCYYSSIFMGKGNSLLVWVSFMLVPACKKCIGNLKLKEKAVVPSLGSQLMVSYNIFQRIGAFQTDSTVFKTGSMGYLLKK